MGIEIAISVISLILSAALSEMQMKNSEKRASHETKVRAIFQAVRDKFGVTINQLDNILTKLDLRLNQLTDSTRGSARLSRASKIYRDFIQAYPNKVSTINKIKDTINTEIASLNAKEAARASQIQNRTDVDYLDVARDIAPSINTVNAALQGNASPQIDTSTVEKQAQSQKRAEQIDTALHAANVNPNSKVGQWVSEKFNKQ